MRYEVSPYIPNEAVVRPVKDGKHLPELAHFSGPNAMDRARAYAQWQNSQIESKSAAAA